MSRRTIVVVGGALAGPAAATRAREIDESARIVMIERNTRVSYAQAGLASRLSGEVGSIDALDRERADFFHGLYGIEVLTGAEVVEVDAALRTVTVRRTTGGAAVDEALGWDALVVAAGAASRAAGVQGLEGTNVRAFRTLDDLQALEAAAGGGGGAGALAGRHVVVLGGGPFGVEAADGLVRGGATVTIVERGARLLPRFARQIEAVAHRALEAAGVRVVTGATAVRADAAGGRVTGVHLSTGEAVPVDAVIVALGLAPRTELLARAGVRLLGDGTVLVDDRAETSVRGVFACGVCVSVPEAVTGAPVWWAQGAIADRTAQVAGANAAGGNARLVPATGATVLRSGDVCIGRAGLDAHEADARLGRDNVGVTVVRAASHEAWFPGTSTLLVRLAWDRRSGRVVGMECAGASGADKRVDAAACAIAGGLTVEALAALDLGYAPAYAPSRDPLNVAASVAAAERAGLAAPVLPRELQARLGAVQVLDVSAPGGARIAGARAIPLEALRGRLAELDATRPVVVVDPTGRRAYLATRLLRQRGFADVRYLAGGLDSWRLLGLPVETAGGGA